MKHLNYFVFSVSLFIFVPSLIFPQQDNSNFYIPANLTFDLSADGHYGFGETNPGFSLDEIRSRISLGLKKYLSINALIKSRTPASERWDKFDKRVNRLTQLYLQYSNSWQALERSINLNIQAGKLEWYPRFTDPQLILEKIDLYLNPPALYGAIFMLDAEIIHNGYLSYHLGANTGDLKDKIYKGGISYSLFRSRIGIFQDFGTYVQLGKSEGSIFLINEAYFYYTPMLYKTVRLDARTGKLPGIEDTPYGFHLGAEILLKYIAIGGYYEKRIDQKKKDQIVGFYWRIIGPEFLATFMNEFRLLYDTNTNTLRFNIPFLYIRLY